jgi:ribosomal protein S9
MQFQKRPTLIAAEKPIVAMKGRQKMTVTCSVLPNGDIKMYINDTNLDVYIQFNTTMAFRLTELS